MTRLCLLVGCALLGVTARATAQPSTAAKPHIEAGVAAYESGDYDRAIREFEVAYDIEGDPVLLYAWAQAQRLGGHCDKAVALYRRYIASKPTETQVVAANTGISLCEQTPPLPPETQPPPVTDPAPRPASESSAWYKDQLGGGLVIGGAASVAIGATFLVLSSRSADAASEARTRTEFLDRLDDATSRRRIGIVVLGIGAGLGVAGVIRYAGLRVSTTGTAVSVSGRF